MLKTKCETDKKEMGAGLLVVAGSLLLAMVLFQLKAYVRDGGILSNLMGDCAREMEHFVCPWLDGEEWELRSLQNRGIYWVSPILAIRDPARGASGAEDGKKLQKQEADKQSGQLGLEEMGTESGKTGQNFGAQEKDGKQSSGSEASEELLLEENGWEPMQDPMQEAVEQSMPNEEVAELPEGEAVTDLSYLEWSLERRTTFVPQEKKLELDLSEFRDYEALVKSFYTIDPTTMAGSDQLNAEKLMARDIRLDKGGDGPQILIYHTHSQEGFRDSVAGDPSTTIVGVGEELAQILREDYGYQVLHHVGEYDKPSRNAAYSKALPKVEELLEKYPSIQVVIDLHRDEMPEKTRLVTELNGKQTAKFMFFNGLSRTKQTGNLDYLYNVYLEDNLAFSFQMEKAAKEYYPDLTRKIYLKGYRYNMHVKPRTLLIELGAQNNTLEEALNACGPLAHLLDVVLQGQ